MTACRTAGGALKLITWRLDNNGSLTRLNDSGNQAGGVSEIAATRLTSGRVATAVRANDGTLKVIVWDVAADGQVSRKGDSGNQAGEARMIRMVRTSNGRLVTSVRAANGNLQTDSWGISGNGETVSRLGDSGRQAGEIGDNALMSRAPGVLSAVRTADGHMKLIAWQVSAAGAIERAGDSYNLAGEATLITFCPESLTGTAQIVTACRTASGDLRLISRTIEPVSAGGSYARRRFRTIEFEGGVPSLEGAAVHISSRTRHMRTPRAVLVLHEVVAAVPRPDGTIPFELRNTVVDEQATYSIRVLVDRDADGRISSGDYINMASLPRADPRASIGGEGARETRKLKRCRDDEPSQALDDDLSPCFAGSTSAAAASCR